MPDDPSTRIPYVDCSVVPGGHADAVCPGGPCPIVSDVEVQCPDHRFAAPGVRVAAAPDATWVATASANDSALFRVATDGGVDRVLLPEHCVERLIHLAVGAQGDLHVVSEVPLSARSHDNGVVYFAEHADWFEQVVDDEGAVQSPVVGFEVDGEIPRVWFGDDGTALFKEAIPGDDGWTKTPVTGIADGYGTERFGRDGAGRLLAADRARSNGLWFLDVLVDGTLTRLGTGSDAGARQHYVLHARTVPTVAPGPPFAALVEDENGIQVVWPLAEEESGVVELDEFSLLVPTCTLINANVGDACDQTCEEHSEGYEAATPSFTRTTDGVGWAVVVTTELNVTYTYEHVCTEPDYCPCWPVVVSNASVSTLHLLRVPLDGAPAAEVLTMTIDPLDATDVSFYGETLAGTHAHAFGTSLAIGLRTYDPDTNDTTVRVLRVETADLAP